MVATRTLVNLRRPSHVAHHDDQRLFEHAAILQILHQTGERVVVNRQQPLLQDGKVPLVCIPDRAVKLRRPRPECVPSHVHKLSAALDELPADQSAVAEQAASVSIANFRRFVVEVKGIADASRSEQVQRVLLSPIEFATFRLPQRIVDLLR